MKKTMLSSGYFTPIAAIARVSFFEQLRSKILLAVLLLGVLGTSSSFFFASISLDQSSRVIQNLGLAAIEVCVALVTIFAATSSISHDADNRVWYLLFSKPVSRAQYVLGKFGGMCLLLLAQILILGGVFSLGLLFVDRSLLGITWITLFFTFLQTSLVLALAILFGCFTAPLNASLYSLALMLVGRSVTGVKEFLATLPGDTQIAQRLTDVVYYVLPNLTKFDVRRILLYGLDLPVWQVVSSLAYWLVYVAIILWLAILVMRKQEV